MVCPFVEMKKIPVLTRRFPPPAIAEVFLKPPAALRKSIGDLHDNPSSPFIAADG